jgi:hypothetical protein
MAEEEGRLSKLVGAYVKIRDAKSAAKKAFDIENDKLTEQQDTIKAALLAHCKTEGVESVKTSKGTFYRTVKTSYWTSDWEEFHKFVLEQQVPELLEKRIAQGNLAVFMEENPDVIPKGLQNKSEYTVSVRKA